MYQDRRVHAFMVACLGRGRPERSLTGTEVAATSRDEIDTLWVAVRIPRQSGRGFRFDVGHRSDLIPATIPK
jgi:hypothetical protein